VQRLQQVQQLQLEQRLRRLVQQLQLVRQLRLQVQQLQLVPFQQEPLALLELLGLLQARHNQPERTSKPRTELSSQTSS
jgi:hypothetical protein